jgi:hypothetical protein
MKIHNSIAAHKNIHAFAKGLSKRCGKNVLWLTNDIMRAKRLNHISLDEYKWVGYYDMTAKQKRTVSTLWTRAELRKKYTNRLYKGVLMNKYIFSKVFSEYFSRGCIHTRDLTPDSLRVLAKSSGKVVYKPISKGQGRGVCVIPAGNDKEISDAMSRIKALPAGILEEFICQHDELNRLNPGAVSIIRFYSVCTPKGMYIFCPVLTTSMTMDISNGCKDALTAIADIRTGVVITDAVDQRLTRDYVVHPVTGVAFKGFQIPFWVETIEMMKKAVPEASYISNIGWDVAITNSGPVIVEANTIPGFNTAQYRGFREITNGMGYQPIFDEAVNGKPFTNMLDYEKVLIRL